MKNITCKDCKYFVLAVEGLGLCHAAPPVVRLMTTTVAPWRLSPATNRPALPVNGKRNEG